MYKFRSISIIILSIILGFNELKADTVEKIPFGDMESWITRNISESKVLGGKKKTVYAIGPTETIEGAKAYIPAKENPWATSNVLANVCGIVKTSNAVSPGIRDSGGKCAVMTTKMEQCKAIGLVNIDVLVSGSIFLGRMFEPIKSTSNPYSKMEMGIPFNKRPKFLQFDYNYSIQGLVSLQTQQAEKPKPILVKIRQRYLSFFSGDGRMTKVISMPNVSVLDVSSLKKRQMAGSTGTASELNTGIFQNQRIISLIWD